jgi:hypothetical protein
MWGMMRGRVGVDRRKEKDKRGEDQQCRGATRGIDRERRKVVLDGYSSRAGNERKVRMGRKGYRGESWFAPQ